MRRPAGSAPRRAAAAADSRTRRRIVDASAGRERRAGAARAEARPAPRAPLTIEGELVAKSTGTVSPFSIGDRVFHMKFGNGDVVAVDGNKLTIAFDKAGEKRVVDSFVQRA